jgi:hypothetical protein
MKYQVTDMDRRHSHHASFNYMLEFSKSVWHCTGVLDFDRARRWMNRTYGWSQEVDTRIAIKRSNAVLQDADINLHWAYSTVYKDYRIYLKGNEELAFFQLAHVQSNS